MKKVFFSFLAVAALASCTQDSTCTCTISEYDLGYGYTSPAVTEVTECLGCTSEETEAFETSCSTADTELQASVAVLQALGVDVTAGCTLD